MVELHKENINVQARAWTSRKQDQLYLPLRDRLVVARCPKGSAEQSKEIAASCYPIKGYDLRKCAKVTLPKNHRLDKFSQLVFNLLEERNSSERERKSFKSPLTTEGEMYLFAELNNLKYRYLREKYLEAYT